MDANPEFAAAMGKTLAAPMANMSLNLAQAFCEKYIKANFAEGSKYPSNFVRLYTKILLERKEFGKAIIFLSGEARSSF